jgi:hypothetical protein
VKYLEIIGKIKIIFSEVRQKQIRSLFNQFRFLILLFSNVNRIHICYSMNSETSYWLATLFCHNVKNRFVYMMMMLLLFD